MEHALPPFFHGQSKKKKMAAAKEAGDVNVIVKWSGKEYVLEDVPLHETVRYLKNLIKEKTGVLPERQKLLGLKCKGK